jgi:hypothetical protein
MLEARKISDQLQRGGSARWWSAFSLISLCLAAVVIFSVWLGIVTDAPKPESQQEKLTQEHAQAVEAAGLLARHLSGEQELNAELLDHLMALRSPLEKFAQTSARGLRVDPQTRDPKIWPGRVNLMLDDLKVLIGARTALLGLFNLRESVIALYKPKGSVSPWRFPEPSVTRSFYLASLEWVQATTPDPAAPKMTWALLAKGRPAWRQLQAHLAALDVEAKIEDDKERAKLAQDLLLVLNKNGLLQQMRSSDSMWTQVWVAQERARGLLEDLPPLPTVVAEPAGLSWHRLAYPGSTSEGLSAGLAFMLLAVALQAIGLAVRRRQVRVFSAQWLSLTQQLENAVRAVDMPLTQAVSRMKALSSDFSPVLEGLRTLRQSMQVTPASRVLEDEAWSTAERMQLELESELALLREKLLNIHVQFCSGTTRENLIYDLAFTTEAVDTIAHSARDLGRSLALLRDSLQHEHAVDKDEEMNTAISQVDALRNASKRAAVQLQELSERLQIAVEDVPEGRRFESSPQRDEQGRLRGNSQV